MKKLNKSMLCMLLTLSCATGFAQKDSRPERFAAYPQTVSLDKSLMINMLNYAEGTNVSVPISADFQFTGTVVSQKKYDNMQTVIIRSDDNTVFQVSEVTRNDKSIVYAGRILSHLHADGYTIKNINGEYSLKKFETAKILEPCNL
ncbi:MAG: hypothetical protein WKF88_01465 [Ferruginibacter sp.]